MQAGTGRAVYKLRQQSRHRYTRRWGIIIVSAVILLLVAGGLWRWKWQSPTAKAMRILVRQFAAQRPVEGRLSGGFKGGRFVPPTQGDTRLPSDEMIAASRLLDEAVQRGEQGARLANARLLLLADEKGSPTLKAFRQTVEAEPTSATAANDLGVCLLARGELEDALATFDQVLQRQPEMPEALFNRALSFEQLQLRDAASADYARLLEIDTDQSWREEVCRRLDAVSATISQQKRYKEIVAAFDRAYAEGNLSEASRITDNDLESLLKHASTTCLLDYLKAAAVTESEVSERELGKIKLVGERLAATFTDKSLLDLAAYLQRLSPAEAAAELALVREYQEMQDTLASREAAEILGIALRLSEQFKARGNRFYEFVATFQAANSSSQLGRHSEAIQKMNEAMKIAETYSWPFRHALVLTQIGSLSARLGQDSLALIYCQKANIVGQGKPYAQSKTAQIMANACWHLGNVSQGLEYLRQSSQLFLTDMPSLSNLASNTLLAADFYRQTDRPDLALHYACQALHYAEEKAHQPTIAQAASFIALELAQRHEFDASQSAMQQAMAALGQIPRRQRAYSQLLVLLRAGDIAAEQGSLEQAESRYAEAQRLAESSEEQPLPLLKVLKARAASYARAGNTAKAKADLKRAIALIETYR
ncbi:MAG: tetratricopeptide repeat protein, partial [Blastocatellia bacterium]